MKTIKQFIQEWDEITLTKVFEVPVIDKRTNEPDYIIFHVEIRGRSFMAEHESLNSKQSKSKKIAFVSIPIDKDFSIQSHLEDLYTECIQAIIDSEYFELSE